MKTQEIEKIIKEAAEKSIYTSSNTVWTKTLNEEFINFAHTNHLSVYCKTEGADWGEWLYDLTICDQNNESLYITSTKLVMESEWLPDDHSIIEDFQKLLLCNADYKVMVFYKNLAIIPDLMKQIKSYKKANGTFILACYTDEDGYVFEEILSNVVD